ncbi:putative receptor-like protein kinase [Quercus suber]|uniref:Receptor-like protein kinase n=1 Tax=Quercus suber TaxID=58331 RepID=A0AAW0LNE1_QUESU
MEMVHSHKTLFQLCLLLPLHFSSLLLLSLAYTVPDKYFINCGASSNASDDHGRIFVADSNSPSFSTGKSEEVSNKSTWIPELYRTARVYRQPCSYSFEIEQNGTHIVRLHFFAYLSHVANLYDALFNVSASGFSLLTNFSIRNSSGSPVIKEFFHTIPQGEFKIHFIPSQDSSLAFVNAIEVFLANETRITDNVTRVTSAGNVGNYKGLLWQSQVLHTIHRINFGGSQNESDDLGRNWVLDDSYLILNRDSAKNSTHHSQNLNYNSTLATSYTAPDGVYQTAKQLKEVSGVNARLLNLTWRFPLSKNTRHFVRVHLCDIVSNTINLLIFNLYIYSNSDQLIDPYNITGYLAVPFFIDYVVDSDDSGFANFSISPSKNDYGIRNAFLNGLEIMEFMSKSGPIPVECEPVKIKKHSPVIKIIGSVSSGAFVILIIVVVLRLKCKKTVPDPSLGGLLYRGIAFIRLTEGNPHEESTTNAILELQFPLAWHLPSDRIQMEEDDHTPNGGDDDSDTKSTESQNPIKD